MKKITKDKIIKPVLTVAILGTAFAISLFLQELMEIKEPITSIFVFGVFLTSLVTEGYIWGIISAFISVLAVNFAFSFPYFAFNFTIPENLVSALIMIIISIITSTLTTKLKHWQGLKAEAEKEKVRANLLRAISHDLRTPLTAIYGSSEALLESGMELTEDQKNRLVSGIKEDSRWLIDMVENLLSVTRIDEGKIELVKTPTSLDELIDAVLLKFKKRYPEKTVTLNIPDEVVIIPMDAMLIGQVLMNVFENSAKHADGADRIEFRAYIEGENAIFEISDNGCGIAEDKLSNILSGCFIAEENVDMKKRNAGIGLSVCSSIVKAHGGTFVAKNKPEGGALVRISLKKEDYDE